MSSYSMLTIQWINLVFRFSNFILVTSFHRCLNHFLCNLLVFFSRMLNCRTSQRSTSKQTQKQNLLNFKIHLSYIHQNALVLFRNPTYSSKSFLLINEPPCVGFFSRFVYDKSHLRATLWCFRYSRTSNRGRRWTNTIWLNFHGEIARRS